jgi:hypothetical protein
MGNAIFTLWNNNNRGGIDENHYVPKGQTHVSDTKSLETKANAWVIIFSEKNYDYDMSGDYILVPEKTYMSDLKKVPRGNGHEWNNDVKSFILYGHKPSWWDSGVRPNHNQLFELVDGQALFTEDKNFLSDNSIFQAPLSKVYLTGTAYTSSGNRMDDEYDPGNISAIRTGNNVWVQVYEDDNCVGNFYKIEPNTIIADLATIDRKDMNGVSHGDWSNDISSLLLYASKPIFWDTKYPGPYIDPHKLCASYPNGTLNSSNTVQYIIEDATYKIYYPGSSECLQSATQWLDAYHGPLDLSNLPTDGWTSFHFHLEHHNSGGQNDTATFYLIFDNNSVLVDVQLFDWSADNGSYNISNAVIKTVDLELTLLGDETAIETLGITIVVADVLKSVFDKVCSVFNSVTEALYKFTDDGGRYYFLPVICHTINRVTSTVFSNYNTTVYTDPSDPRAKQLLDFNYSYYRNAIQSSGIAFSWVGDWSAFPNSNGTAPYNNVMEMTYHNYNYRTWYLETSLSQSLGMLVSCKIDYEIDGKDDHIILMAGFTMPPLGSTAPVLAFAQATIQFSDGSNANITTDLYSKGDIVSQLFTNLHNQLANVKHDASTGGRVYLADVAKANLNAMVACTQVKPIYL